MFFEALDEFGGFFLAGAYGGIPEQGFVALDGAFDSAAGADDGAVIALAHALADLGEAEFGGLADQEHGDASGEADGSLAAAGHEVFEFQTEIGADGLKDVVGLDGCDELFVEVAEGFLGHGQVGGLAGEFDMGGHASDGAFKLADVLGDAAGDPACDLIGHDKAGAKGKAAEDFAAGQEVGGIDADDHATDEAVDQRFAEFLDHLGMIVAGHDDLPAHGLDGVEGVEEFLLGGLFAAEEMDIIDDQEIELAHAMAEGVELVAAKGGEKFVSEFLAGEISPSAGGVVLDEALAQAVEEMGLAQAAGAVEEEGVVLAAGEFGDVLDGIAGELAGGSDDEGFQIVAKSLALHDAGGEFKRSR